MRYKVTVRDADGFGYVLAFEQWPGDAWVGEMLRLGHKRARRGA